MPASWFLVSGVVLVLMAFASRAFERLPVSPAILYLLVGVAIGPAGLGVVILDEARDAKLMVGFTEAALLVALFGVGLRLPRDLPARSWRPAVSLATLGMLVSVALGALAGVALLGFEPALALLLAACLAPTDPVLASDVQVRSPADRDALRFSLSVEGALNDGTALPVVLFALAWQARGSLDGWLARWLAIDLAWAAVAGVLVGWASGRVCARVIVALRGRGSDVSSEAFLVLGLIGLSYGVAQLAAANGFLAVFFAAFAVRTADPAANDVAAARALESPDPQRPPASVGGQLLRFSAQLEQLAEVPVALLVGTLLAHVHVTAMALAYAALWLLVVRPACALASLAGTRLARSQRRLIAWFGVRGIGTVFYLEYAIAHAGADAGRNDFLSAVLIVVVASVVLHGVSGTPVMQWYRQRRAAGRG